MKVAAIETSGLIGSVAVCEDDHCLGERSFERGARHGQSLLPSIEEIFRNLGWVTEDVDLIAVSHGPGSFTGLRVGVTCAKTLAYVLKRPLVAVPTLDVLAENVIPGDIPVCPILDAKRNAVYACIYKPVNGIWQRQAVSISAEPNARKTVLLLPSSPEAETAFLAIKPQDLLPLLPRPVIVFGDGIPPYRELFNVDGILTKDDRLGIARASVVARLGIRLYERGEVSDPFQLQPLYLRRPEAEEKWELKK